MLGRLRVAVGKFPMKDGFCRFLEVLSGRNKVCRDPPKYLLPSVKFSNGCVQADLKIDIEPCLEPLMSVFH